MTGPVPDISGPASLGDVFRAFTPPGTDSEQLLAALKASEMPSFPRNRIGNAQKAATGMRWCRQCGRPEPAGARCPNDTRDTELLRVFRTGNLRLIHAASCPFRNWSMTSCGVR